MMFGFIKVNGQIAQVFINQSDAFVKRKFEDFKNQMADMILIIEWDNFPSNKRLDELESFMRTK